MKKLFFIALVGVGLLAGAAPESQARVFVNVGFGFGVPVYPYPYGYYPAYPVYPVYYAPPIYLGYRPAYWWYGRRGRCW